MEPLKIFASGIKELSTQWGHQFVLRYRNCGLEAAEVRDTSLEVLNDPEEEKIESKNSVSLPAWLEKTYIQKQEEQHRARLQEKEAKTHRLAEEAHLRQEKHQRHSLVRPAPLWPASVLTPAPAPTPEPQCTPGRARKRARKRARASASALVPASLPAPELRIHVKKIGRAHV